MELTQAAESRPRRSSNPEVRLFVRVAQHEQLPSDAHLPEKVYRGIFLSKNL